MEDIDWIFDEGIPASTIVYNKGPDLPQRGRLSVVRTCNYGKEVYAYLLHIIHAYDKLADITIFFQADPFQHYIERRTLGSKLQQLRAQMLVPGGPSFVGFGRELTCSKTGREHYACMVEDALAGMFGEQQVPADHSIYPLRYYEGANFAASRALLRSRPLSFYWRLLRMVHGAIDPQQLSYAFERLWGAVLLNATAVPLHGN
jgi:hypothetical protein